ncbi:tRNA (guanine(26)-N(2))-dimethyltransferase [Quillaja saponaria]|uniref:tRNA (guanine(26)-N(2))-dimethyltransferase n=1 Tax=Quillaja saponaria TaxID=32244 RepID=A0AAD7PXT5_QUISA|nr:tRNA (guanine(26)-N(2))-dimethyltransferase [Quillaja saponaria]
MSTDLNDFKIIKEGEAEILMHAKNEVFYTQVNNRDISIAVLRAFVTKRRHEHEAMLSRRTKQPQKVSENNSSVTVVENKPHKCLMDDEMSNGDCAVPEEISQDEQCSIIEEPIKNTEGKACGELKPLRVLEALSASGLRALRYAREVDDIGQVVALDNDKGGIEFILYISSHCQLKLAEGTSSLMVRLHVQRWNHTLLMLEYICLLTLKNLMCVSG